MARNQTGRRRRFAELLSKHLTNGTRPATEAGEPWTDSAFAAEVHSQRETNDFVSPRSVSNWRKAKSVPAAIDPILRALFGPGQRHAQARDELRTAFLAARAEKIGNARRNSAGPRWVASDDEFVIDSAATRSDETAALDPQRRLLQQAVPSIAAELASVAGRLSNSRTWGSLSGTADALHVASAADPIALTRRLGEAYPTLLRLGRFLETDIRIQRDPTSLDDPLDPDVQGLLTDLVRTAAPWLRGFPTVEAWDDAAGRYLLRVNLLSAARDFIRVARAKGAISETSASRMEWIEEDEHQGFQGQKANAWGVGGAQNLILATAEVMALFLSGALPSGAGSQSLLVERAAATLSEAGEQVEKFAETLPSDLGQALRELVKEAALSTQSSSPRATGESVPPDVEEQAATMILEGHSPPAAWRPFIRRLSFKGTNLSALDLLANLNALEELDLRSTSVTDISPLAELSTLRTLDLRGTVVNDVSALSNLRALQNLNLRFTSVQDITPLSRLVELTFLDLRRAQVSDISPISDLTNLQWLDLARTLVANIAPLAGLTLLRRLVLEATPIEDIEPLGNLTDLQHLELSDTNVTRFAPLPSLTALRYLDLSNTQFRDPYQLSFLKGLRHLDLYNTEVDYGIYFLSHLSALEYLDLRKTRIDHIGDLSGLRSLRHLRLSRAVPGLRSLQRETLEISIDDD